MTDDEIEIQTRECYAHIARIQQDYQRAIQPYVDILIRLESVRIRPVMVRRDQLDGAWLSAFATVYQKEPNP